MAICAVLQFITNLDASVMSRVPVLDGLRGIAILLVLFYHVWTGVSGVQLYSGNFYPAAWLYAGNTGVTLFFVLSGFLVSRPFIEARRRGEYYSLRHYAMQRIFRILPAYLIVAAVAIYMYGDGSKIVRVLAFAAQGFELGPFSAVWWSLSTEIQFYILFPLVFLVFAYCGAVAKGVAVGLLVCVYINVVFQYWTPQYFRSSYAFWAQMLYSVAGQMPAFVVGVLLQYFGSTRLRFSNAASVSSVGLVLTLMTVQLGGVANVGPIEYMKTNPWYVLPEALLWGAVMFVAMSSRGMLQELLAGRLLRFFGRISYSLYLVHLPVTSAAKVLFPQQDRYLIVLLVLAVSVGLAWLMWICIEKPGLDLKQYATKLLIRRGIAISRSRAASTPRVPSLRSP